MARAKQEKEIEITLEDVELIMGNEFRHFDTIVENVFCSTCPAHMTTITGYKIYLNNLEDILLRGTCKSCGGPVGRYIETGENQDQAAVARHIRTVVNKYKLIKK